MLANVTAPTFSELELEDDSTPSAERGEGGGEGEHT